MKDYTTPEQRIRGNKEKFINLPTLTELILIILFFAFLGLIGTIETQNLKLHKCQAFNNNEEATTNCFFDN